MTEVDKTPGMEKIARDIIPTGVWNSSSLEFELCISSEKNTHRSEHKIEIIDSIVRGYW